MRKASIGEQEMELLRFVAEEGALTGAEVTERFAGPRGLARTTVHTMLERLRKKGYLAREKQGGVFVYSACQPKSVFLTTMVGQFVQRTLGGSLRPLAAYLAQADDLNEEELRELRAVVDGLKAGSRKTGKEDGHGSIH